MAQRSDAPHDARPGRGRPRNFEPDRALEAAMLTFWRKGYVHTSLDDLVLETGASRGSLYKTFGDKKALFIRSLDLYARNFEVRAADAMAREPDAYSVMRALLTASAARLSGNIAPAGCLRCNSTLEIGGIDAELDAALADANARFLGVMTGVLHRAVEEGAIADGDAERLATFFTGTVAGLVSLAKSGASPGALMDMADTALMVWPERAARQTTIGLRSRGRAAPQPDPDDLGLDILKIGAYFRAVGS